MRPFIIIWFGQLVSTIGSFMTGFALTLWAWEMTESATTLALVGFFSQLPRIPVALVAGLIVDRFNRKFLMIVGDSVAALSTVGIGLLFLTDHLQIWHLYFAASLNGSFGQIQTLAYQASLSSLVPPLQLTRANSMNSAVHYSSVILGPAFAGLLYPFIGLAGIVLIDLTTFGVAIATLLCVHIPQPAPQDVKPTSQDVIEIETLFSKLTFGFREIWRQPNLQAMLWISALFVFFHDLAGAIYEPMILARTDGSTTVLASILTTAGLGGVTGAVLLSVWGGPKRRVTGMLAGYIGAGVSKMVFGLGRSPLIWFPAQFCSSLHFPLLGSSRTAIWMTQIAPEKQGRVFAADTLVAQVMRAIAPLVAGPLADQLFEPLMLSDLRLTFVLSPIFGAGSGAGMAFLYVLCSLCMVLVGSLVFFMNNLRTMEE